MTKSKLSQPIAIYPIQQISKRGNSAQRWKTEQQWLTRLPARQYLPPKKTSTEKQQPTFQLTTQTKGQLTERANKIVHKWVSPRRWEDLRFPSYYKWHIVVRNSCITIQGPKMKKGLLFLQLCQPLTCSSNRRTIQNKIGQYKTSFTAQTDWEIQGWTKKCRNNGREDNSWPASKEAKESKLRKNWCKFTRTCS